VEVKELDLKNEKDFSFSYELALVPEINVTLDKDVHLPYYNIEVSEDMINEQDKNFRERFGAQVPGEEVEANSLVKGSIMELDEAGNVKTSDDAIQMINGIVAPMYFKDKAEADKFIGKKVNDKVVFNPWKTCEGNAAELSSMLGVDKSKAADIKGDFELSISEIIVLRPAELGQELYDNVLGKDKATTEEEYRNALKDMIARELSRNSEMLFRVDTEKAMMEKYGDMELPVEILKKWLIRRNDELNDANIDEEYAKMEQGLKWQLIKERIGEICQIKIEEQDLIGHAKMIASMQFAQYGMTNMDDDTLTDYAKRILADKNYRPRIVEEVGDIKLFAAVKEAVTINAENVTLDKFKEIATKQ
jgi:trigger factor